MALLLRQGNGNNARVANGVVRRAADAVTNLAHENAHIKTRVRLVLKLMLVMVTLLLVTVENSNMYRSLVQDGRRYSSVGQAFRIY